MKVESVDTATTRRLSIPRLEMSEGKADAVTSITALLDRAVVWAPGGKIASMYWAVYLVHLGSLRIQISMRPSFADFATARPDGAHQGLVALLESRPA